MICFILLNTYMTLAHTMSQNSKQTIFNRRSMQQQKDTKKVNELMCTFVWMYMLRHELFAATFLRLKSQCSVMTAGPLLECHPLNQTLFYQQ